MEAILPDLNTGYIKYRTKIMESIDADKTLNVIGSLFATNAMLPKDHQIIIDDDLYNERIRQMTIAKCNYCSSEYAKTDDPTKRETRPTEHNFKDLHVFSTLLSIEDSFIMGSNYDKVWNCPICHKNNRLKNTKFIKTALRKPYFLQVVPNPPEKKDGMTNRKTYLKNLKNWAWGFLDEIEFQMGEYRRNYVPKDQGFQEHEVNSQQTLDEEIWQ